MTSRNVTLACSMASGGMFAASAASGFLGASDICHGLIGLGLFLQGLAIIPILSDHADS